MSQTVVYLLIGVCLLVILACSAYIVGYWRRQRERRQAEVKQLETQQQNMQERRAYLIESIQVIARAVGEDEKLTLTEACIRLSTLLESLSPELVKQPEVSVIREMHYRTQHIPIKEKWQQLSKQEQWKLRLEMSKLEQQYEKEILAAADYLATYDFKRMMMH